MSVFVTRDGGGISLNAGIRESLRDRLGEEMLFDSKEKAIEFLKSTGLTEEDMEFLEYVEV